MTDHETNRNYNPVEELRQHLNSLRVPVQTEPILPDEVEKRVMGMSLQAYIE